MTFIFVALGGAVGACGRYAISLIPVKTQYPILTLITNLLGALLIGFIVGIAKSRNVSKNTMLFLKTGAYQKKSIAGDILTAEKAQEDLKAFLDKE